MNEIVGGRAFVCGLLLSLRMEIYKWERKGDQPSCIPTRYNPLGSLLESFLQDVGLTGSIERDYLDTGFSIESCIFSCPVSVL